MDARTRLALLVVLLAGTVLILPRLGSQSLWLDEGFTVMPALESHGLADLVDRVRQHDTQPPASHLLLYLLRDLLPRGEFGWRLPSFLVAEAGLVVLCGAVARRWGARAGWLAMLAAQMSPFLAFYAMEARNYALWSFASAVALYSMVRCAEALEADGAGRTATSAAPGRALVVWTIAWGAANALGLWTHLFHLFAIATQVVLAAGLILLSPLTPGARRRALISVAAAQALAGALFLPWIVAMARSSATLSGVGWTRPPVLASLLYYPFAMVFGFSLGPDLRELHQETMRRMVAHHAVALCAAAAALAVLALALLLLARQAWIDPRSRRTLLVPFSALAAGLAGPTLYAVVAGFPLLPRHLMFAWPALPILQALAWERLPPLRPALAAVIAVQLVALGNLLYNPAYAKDDERGAVRFAEAHSGASAVIVGDVAPLYTEHARGFVRNFTDPGQQGLYDDATDAWLVDNRPWEDPEGRYRARMGRALAEAGLEPAGEDARFRGVVLRHWRRGPAS
jgi:hypothetical protein